MIRTASTLVTLLLLSATSAAAAIIGPVWPAPGGTTYTQVGSNRTTGGATGTYTAFDTSQFDDLYWGYEQVLAPLFSGTSGGASTSQALTAGALGGGEIVWDGANWMITTAFGSTPSYDIRFRTSIFDLNGNNITNQVVSGSSVGLPTMPYLLAMDAATLAGWGGGFKVFSAFEAYNGSSWVGVTNLYDSLSTPAGCTSCVKTATSGVLYYTEPVAAPEPASLLLFGLSAFAVAGSLRRRTGPGSGR